MTEPHYHLFAPDLSPDIDGVAIGRDVLARNRTSGQAVVLRSFRFPWRPILDDEQKDAYRQLRHPALVGFLRTEASLAHGTLYAYHAYQFEPLGDALESVQAAVGYDTGVWLEAFAEAAEALDVLAQTGLSHGAINFETLVLTRVDQRIRVKDVGLGIRPGDDLNRALQSLAPLFAYIAPEVFDSLLQGRPTLPSLAADVYSFGAVLHRFFFGREPIDASQATQSPRDTVRRILEGALDLEENWQEQPILTGIVHRALHPDPAARYTDFGSLAHDLRLAAQWVIEFGGEDAFGLHFSDVHGNELRVLPPHLTVTDLTQASLADRLAEEEAELNAALGGGPDEDGAFDGAYDPTAAAEHSEGPGTLLVPTWRLDPGTRTLVRSDLSAWLPPDDAPIADPELVSVGYEYAFANGMADLATIEPDGPFVSHSDLLWADASGTRRALLYPTLRPRAGEEAAFVEWVEQLAEAGHPALVPPEVWQHAYALAQGQAVPDFDAIVPEAAARTSVWILGRLIYHGLTSTPIPVDPMAAALPTPAAYHEVPAVSAQFSQLLAATLAANPDARVATAADLATEYEERQTRQFRRNAEADA